MNTQANDITQLLADWQDGEREAFDRLFPTVYEELRRIAVGSLRNQHPDFTLQPTALVSEAYIKLQGSENLDFETRNHFFAIAAKAMRQVLVDQARKAAAAKRPDRQKLVTLGPWNEIEEPGDDPVDLLALDQAIERLAAVNGRQAQIVEMRYFGGLTHTEIGEVLEVSEPTVRRDWRTARLALQLFLEPPSNSSPERVHPGGSLAQ